jgi:hypothetical protein
MINYDEITFLDAISVIRGLGQEWEAIKMLTDLVRADKEISDKQNAEMAYCLTAIKKINKNKNEAIDALCEFERR